jgi:hypothetical protein
LITLQQARTLKGQAEIKRTTLAHPHYWVYLAGTIEGKEWNSSRNSDFRTKALMLKHEAEKLRSG